MRVGELAGACSRRIDVSADLSIRFLRKRTWSRCATVDALPVIVMLSLHYSLLRLACDAGGHVLGILTKVCR